MMIVAIILAQLGCSILTSYFTFCVLEEIYDFRQCIKENPEGGYYQNFSLAQRVAARYLKYTIFVDKLPQGGYSVYPYNRRFHGSK